MSSEKQPNSGISVQTLLISSLAAVAAAVVVPMFWERGSLIATAVTPIIVAIVSEALNRPAKVITDVAPRVARRSATGAAVRTRQPSGVGARGAGPERAWGPADDPFGLRTPESGRRRFPLKLAIITGLLAAVIGALVVTASELAIFGHSVGDSGRSTSVWGGRERARDAKETATPAPDATETAAPQATETPTAAPTETAPATPTATSTPVPAPAQTVAPAEPTPTP